MATRRHLRFVTHQKVELRADDRNDLRLVWMTDISKGGLFVETNDPPPMRQRVTVTLQTPDGAVPLAAEVVHIVDAENAARMGASPGVGLQFVNLDADLREAIQAYVEGLSAALIIEDAPASATTDNLISVMAVIRQVLDGFEQEDVYAALQIEPTSSAEAIERRIDDLLAQLHAADGRLTAAQASRASHVRNLLRRVQAMMSSAERRFDYDLRHGHLNPRARMEDAQPHERARLRQLWHRHYPQAMGEAEKYASLALRYEGVMKYQEAIESARKALDSDPFNYELWLAIDTWQARLDLEHDDGELELP